MDSEALNKEIQRLKLTDDEIKQVLKNLKNPPKITEKTFDLYSNSNSINLGIVTDTHIGSKHHDKQTFEDSVKVFNKEKVDYVLHAGDIVDGMGSFDGFVYELELIGYHAQVKKASELLSEYKAPVKFITGNHDRWGKQKANIGYLVGPDLESKIKNSQFLGEMTADLKINDNLIIRLTHEGNTSYALSYSGQKRINALEGGAKPNVIFNGHIHKALYMFYRNIHYFEVGTTERQTTWMREKGSPAMLGFWTVKIEYNKNGLNGITPKFYPHY